MRMKLKKILISIICIMIQNLYVVSAKEDATQSVEYQSVMQKVRQRNSGEQPTSQVPNAPKAPTPQTLVIPRPTSNIPNNIVVPTMPNVQYPTITIPMYVSDRQIKYNKILEANKNLFKNNNEVLKDYINAVEDYRTMYGDLTLKSTNIANYIPIMKNLGFAYERTSNLDKAIMTYEILLKEKQTDINIKKHLLYLYDKVTSCLDVENMLNQIQKDEPNYNPNLINCTVNIITNTPNPNSSQQTNDIENDNPSENNTDSTLIVTPLNFIFLIIPGLSILVYIFGCLLKHNKEKEEQQQRFQEEYRNKQLENEQLEQKRKQQEQEELKRRQEAYRIKQLEQARLEQERKQRELEEQKRKTQERAMRLQKNYWYNHVKDYEFEDKIGELFQELGYSVTVTQKSGDGGVDVIIKKDNVIKCVQCKHYKENNFVKIGDIRALWGVKEDFNASGVIMVTTGKISRDGFEFIKRRGADYELWTIDTILAKAREVNYNYKS